MSWLTVLTHIALLYHTESTPKRPPPRLLSTPFDEIFEPLGSEDDASGDTTEVTPPRPNLYVREEQILSESEFLRALQRALMTP